MFSIDIDRIVKRVHPIIFGLIVLASLVEMSLSAWVTSKYISRHNSPNTNTTTRVRFVLFASVWTLVLSIVYAVAFQLWTSSAYWSNPNPFVIKSIEKFSGTVSHLISVGLTWIFWLAAAASMTTTLGGTLDCNAQSYFLYCGQLNAMLVFAWLIWVLVSIALVIVLLCGIRSAKRGEGFSGGLMAGHAVQRDHFGLEEWDFRGPVSWDEEL